MSKPVVNPWIEQPYNIVVIIQKRSQVRAFMIVAMRAGIRQIFEFRAAPVLQAGDMVNLEREKQIVLPKPAVLATIISPMRHQPSNWNGYNDFHSANSSRARTFARLINRSKASSRSRSSWSSAVILPSFRRLMSSSTQSESWGDALSAIIFSGAKCAKSAATSPNASVTLI